MKKQQAEWQWFVESLDDQTNQVVFRHLAQIGAGGEENMIVHLPDSQGTFHNVLKVPDHRFVSLLQRSRQSLDLHFLVFNRRGEEGKIKFWPFNVKKRVPPEVQKRIDKARQAGLGAQ